MNYREMLCLAFLFWRRWPPPSGRFGMLGGIEGNVEFGILRRIAIDRTRRPCVAVRPNLVAKLV